MFVVEIYQLPNLWYVGLYSTFEYIYTLVAVSDGCKTFQIDQCCKRNCKMALDLIINQIKNAFQLWLHSNIRMHEIILMC